MLVGKIHRHYILTHTHTEFVADGACQHTRCFVQAKFEAGGAWRGGGIRRCFGNIILLIRLHCSRTACGRNLRAARAKEGEFKALLRK